ncbi:MAG: hypothetical protein KDE09_19500 [Anaerolineales bacterium]|nr:hypothetical protein [Anaerolineales bacterium]MCB0019989.1 hypothetical protein [Anaerolineales bacterium]MCB8959776.1 acyl carrier protein [Ardenticatenales bacterium]
MSMQTVNMAQIQTTLLDVLSNLAPEKDLSLYESNTGIQEALDIDSFDYLNFLIELESLYGVAVPEADYDQLVTLDDVVDYLLDRL